MVTEGVPVEEAARQLGLVEQALRNWVEAHRKASPTRDVPLSVDERARLRELEREPRPSSPRLSVTEIYEFIDGEKGNYPVSVICGWMSVSRSGFYEWRDKPVSATVERREALKSEIRRIFADAHGTYGYRRVHAVLAHDGVQAGPELVRPLMRQLGLHPRRKRLSHGRFPPRTRPRAIPRT